MKNTTKGAIAAGLIVTSASIISYANSDSSKKDSTIAKNSTELVLDVEKVDSDTVKVSIDNIKEVPKALQFSIKLDGDVVLKENEGSIKDLINETVNSRKGAYANTNNVLTDYSYNSATNEIDVLITATDSLPKTENKVEVFELDVKAKESRNKTAPKYKVVPASGKEFKYVSNTNKEYDSLKPSHDNLEITMNEKPEIKVANPIINVIEGEVLALTEDKLGITITDKDGETPKLEVRQVSKGNSIISEFKENTPGIYDLEAMAIDSYGEKSETAKIQVAVEMDSTVKTPPTILLDGKELANVEINAGDIFEPMKEIKATDAKGRDVNVVLTTDKAINLNPDVDTVYTLTYTATDIYKNKTTKSITLTVRANKAPIINGVIKNHVIKVGDSFDPMKGITVTDEDKNLKIEVESNLNTNVPGVYTIKYKVTDTKGKTTRVESTVTVNPKSEEVNVAPVIIASNRTAKVGEAFNPSDGAKAIDKEDGDIDVELIESTVPVDGNGVITKDGNYTVSLKAVDSKGAVATKTITVTVEKRIVDEPEKPEKQVEPPVEPEKPEPEKPEVPSEPEKPTKPEVINMVPIITAEDRTIKVGDKFIPLEGVEATDKEDGVVKVEIVKNTVPIDKKGIVISYGKFDVSFKAVDSKGATATKTITITVNPKTEMINSAPVIIANDRTVKVGEKFNPLEGIIGTDNEDGVIKVEIVESTVPVDKDGIITKEGKFMVLVKATDIKGATTTKVVTITVEKKSIEGPEEPNKPEQPEEGKPEEPNKPEQSEEGKTEELNKPEVEQPQLDKGELPNAGDKGVLGVIGVGLASLAGLFVINKRKK